MVTLVLTPEEAEFLYDLLIHEADLHDEDDPQVNDAAVAEMCKRLAGQLEPGGA